MNPLFAPADSRQRALFYSQISTLLRAGFPLIASLEHLLANPVARSLESHVSRMLDGLNAGMTFSESLDRMGNWAPDFDIALIRAGESSGTLDRSLTILSRHHEARADNLRVVLQESVYPTLVIHIAIFIVPLPQLAQSGDVFGYLSRSLGTLFGGYVLVLLFLISIHPSRSHRWRAKMESLIIKIPLWGAARSDLALARLAGALGALLSAGILVTEAWPQAAKASGSPLLEKVVSRWDHLLESGATPAELIARSGVFPAFFTSAYSTGELSGQLEQQLDRLSQYHETEGFRKLRTLSVWSPRLLYGGVAIWIAFQILALAGGYMTTLNDLLGE